MLTCGICDDEQDMRGYLESQIKAWGETRGEAVCVRQFPSAEAFLFAYAADKIFDLLLLDVKMGQMDGIALANKIRAENARVQIVFVTGVPDYMGAGYDLAALHYLLKPLRPEKLYAVLDRAREQLFCEEPLVLVDRDGVCEKLPEKEILYAQIDARLVKIVCKNHTLETRLPLKELEVLLGGGAFVRCHRAYIAGLRHIKRITQSAVYLEDGTALPLARRAYRPVNQAFISFYKRDKA